MKKEDRDLLAARMRNQDNCATAHPLFVVQQVVRIYGMDVSYVGTYVWMKDCDGEDTHETDADLIAYLRELEQDAPRDEAEQLMLPTHDCDIVLSDYGYEKIGYHEYHAHVSAHFTRMAAELYISQNSHNLKKPRIFVESQHRCYEWIEVVNHIKATW